MGNANESFIASIFIANGKIYVWVGQGEPREMPAGVQVLDHLTQRGSEDEPLFFRRVNQFMRAEAKQRGAQISHLLEPEAPAN